METFHKWAILVLCFLVSPAASAGLRWSVFGTGSITQLAGTNLPDPTFKSGELGIGAGSAIEFPVGRTVGIEVGLLYLKRRLTQEFSNAGIVYADTNYLYIPVLMRLHFGKVLSLVAGAYIANGFGNVKMINASGSVVEGTFGDAQIVKPDLGITAGLGINIPIRPFLQLIMEGRYSHGIVNVGTAIPVDAIVNYTDIIGLFGIQFGNFKSRRR
jgi:hypothetical protein